MRQNLDRATQGKASRLIRAAFTDDTVWIRLAIGAAYLRLHRDYATPDSPLFPLIDANLDFLKANLFKTFKDSIRYEFSRAF